MLDFLKNQRLSNPSRKNQLTRIFGRAATIHEITSRMIGDVLTKAFISCRQSLSDERGDVPGWVLVVLMTTGLVTGIWTLAAPRIDSILKNSLDSMNGIR